MNDCWKILGIEPTDNKREIRSAYAAKSKQYHIEESPEQFAKLNQAYQEALEYVSVRVDGSLKQQDPGSALQKRRDKNEVQPRQQNVGLTVNQPERNRDDGLLESPSLLERLQQAEDAQVQESITAGALKKFIGIFENARETGKVPRADVWKDFFLSEEFLKEQYEEGFAKGMLQYLSEWSMEGNYNVHALPSPFLLELAIAYALMPEQAGNFPKGKMQYEVKAKGSFYGRECAASLWNTQHGREYFPVRILYKPENLVRLRSFSDYIRMRSLNRKNQLTPGNKGIWKEIVGRGCDNHLYERGRKGDREIYEETRSICLIRLYTFWVQDDEVPACVLEHMYKEYNLKNVEHSSSKALYGPLRQEIIKKYADIEDAVFGAESQAQLESQWYREMARIVADNHSDYDKGIYTETEKTKERVRALFDRPEWPGIQNSQGLLDKMYEQFRSRMVVPKSLAKRLIDLYCAGGKWEDTQKAAAIVEGLTQSMAFNRRIQDIDGSEPLGCGNAGIEDIHDDNRDFWYYYLMVGYGFRKADMDFTEEHSSKYALGSSCYLPRYIEHMYYSPLQWRRRFVRCMGAEPAATEFLLPDGKRLRVEFYLHYCLYILDGICIYKPEYTFGEFVRLAGEMEKTEQFFFLLAITEIGREEQDLAQRLIEERLSRLVLYPSTIPVIARLLARGEEELVQVSDYSGGFRHYKKAAPVIQSHQARIDAGMQVKETEEVSAIYYTEQESYCLRVLVTDRTVRLYNQREFGWHELPLPCSFVQSEPMGLEERKQWAKKALDNLQKPQPALLETISLEGMENEEKASKILGALKRYEENRRREQAWNPHPPQSALPALEDFFQKEGSYLSESYCVLCFGSDKRNERTFYCGIHPYAFEPGDHNPQFGSSYQFRLNELSRKIKEKHWVIGNFGWGDVYTPKEGFVPLPFAIGQSGTYYNYDVIRMYRTDNLTALLAKMFDFTNVTEVKTYKGCLGFSALDNSLEYCFSEADLRQSMYCADITDADIFVRFTKAERMAQFARWVNEILARADRLCLPLFIVEQHEENIYLLSLYNSLEFDIEATSAQVKTLMGETPRLVWKTEGITFLDLKKALGELVVWYIEHGTFGWKLKNCLKIKAVAFTLQGKKHQSYLDADDKTPLRDAPLDEALRSGCTPQGWTRSNWTVFENKMRLLQAVMERTAVKAYSLGVAREGEPDLFDSKIGGLPYWEPGKEYPHDANGKKLALMAQINLDRNPMEELIPGGGMLQFFGAADEIFSRGFGSREDQEQYRVIYHAQVDYGISKEMLTELGLPDSTKCYPNYTPVARERLLTVEEMDVFMGVEDYRFSGELKTALKEIFGLNADTISDVFHKELEELLEGGKEFEDVSDSLSNHGLMLLGYPAFASNRKDPRGEKEDLRKYDQLLFQFDMHDLDDSYDLDSGHGCGIANFFIRSEDLARREFGRVMYHWECCDDEMDEEDWD